MQISYNGTQKICEYEGFRDKAYKDSAGIWTIGFGSIKVDGIPVQQGQTITREKAVLQMQQDLAWAQTAVNKLVRVGLAQHQFDALVSLVYNIGETNFSKSTLLKHLNQQNFILAAQEFPKWNKAGGKIVQGLTNRRLAEKEMFEGK
jgi:lysozyme